MMTTTRYEKVDYVPELKNGKNIWKGPGVVFYECIEGKCKGEINAVIEGSSDEKILKFLNKPISE